MQKNNINREKAFLIGVILRGSNPVKISEQLDELKLLADTAGADTVRTSTQTRHKPNSATFIGKGKIQSIIKMHSRLYPNLNKGKA